MQKDKQAEFGQKFPLICRQDESDKKKIHLFIAPKFGFRLKEKEQVGHTSKVPLQPLCFLVFLGLAPGSIIILTNNPSSTHMVHTFRGPLKQEVKDGIASFVSI